MQEYHRVEHTFQPIYNSKSKVLILGSLPSVKSRENDFYYGHSQNRFWKVISGIYGEAEPQNVEEKIKLLLNSKVALWDVIKCCEIKGSSDSSIRNVIPMDLNYVLKKVDIEAIYANGKTAAKLYRKFCQELIGREIIELPSTSPANAAYTVDKLLEKWEAIRRE